MIARARCRVRVGGPASRRGFCSGGGGGCGVGGCRFWFGRAVRLGRVEVGDDVIKVSPAAHRGGVGEHISGISELELFAEPGGDLVAVDRSMPSGQIDHRFQADGALVAEQGTLPTQQHRANVLHSGHAAAGGQGFLAEVNVDDCPGPRPVKIERRCLSCRDRWAPSPTGSEIGRGRSIVLVVGVGRDRPARPPQTRPPPHRNRPGPSRPPHRLRLVQEQDRRVRWVRPSRRVGAGRAVAGLPRVGRGCRWLWSGAPRSDRCRLGG